MNAAQARNIAKAMHKRGLPAYAGKYGIASTIGAPVKALTPTVIKKVMVQFLEQVATSQRPAIEKLFAEEEIVKWQQPPSPK